MRLVAAGGRRIIPHNEAETLLKEDNVYINDKAYEVSMPDYFRFDMRVGYKFNGQRNTHEIAMDMINLTNRPNKWERRYNGTSKQIETIYQQGFFVTILYRLNF